MKKIQIHYIIVIIKLINKIHIRIKKLSIKTKDNFNLFHNSHILLKYMKNLIKNQIS